MPQLPLPAPCLAPCHLPFVTWLGQFSIKAARALACLLSHAHILSPCSLQRKPTTQCFLPCTYHTGFLLPFLSSLSSDSLMTQPSITPRNQSSSPQRETKFLPKSKRTYKDPGVSTNALVIVLRNPFIHWWRLTKAAWIESRGSISLDGKTSIFNLTNLYLNCTISFNCRGEQ